MIEGNVSANRPQLEVLKKALLAQGLSTVEEQTMLFNINLEIEKIHAIETLIEKPVLFEVIYTADIGLFDGVTTNSIYPVIEELEHQYVVINDRLSTSRLSKEKFAIKKEQVVSTDKG